MLSRTLIDAASRQITFVANDVGGAGGMEEQTARLIEGMLERGWEVSVISWRCRLAPHPRLRWVRVWGPRRPFSIAMPIFFFVAGILVALRRRGIVHANGAVIGNRVDLTTVHFCHRAFRKTGISRASRAHPAFRLNSWAAASLSRLAESWCYRPSRTGKLVAVSRGLLAELRSEFPAMRDRSEVVPNGVDVGHFSPGTPRGADVRRSLGIAPDAPVGLFVGGDWERKGLRCAVDAVARTDPWHLLVVGDGDRRAYVDAARSGGSAERLHFVGSRADVVPFFAASTAFVFPTAYETFSLVTYEAAAMGLPLLVTNVSGVNEILEDGGTGWFISRNPEEISRRLRELQGQPAKRIAMGQRAREAARAYGWDRIIERYESLYESATSPGEHFMADSHAEAPADE